jgi:hypothetical protein
MDGHILAAAQRQAAEEHSSQVQLDVVQPPAMRHAVGAGVTAAINDRVKDSRKARAAKRATHGLPWIQVPSAEPVVLAEGIDRVTEVVKDVTTGAKDDGEKVTGAVEGAVSNAVPATPDLAAGPIDSSGPGYPEPSPSPSSSKTSSGSGSGSGSGSSGSGHSGSGHSGSDNSGSGSSNSGSGSGG